MFGSVVFLIICLDSVFKKSKYSERMEERIEYYEKQDREFNQN